MSAKLNFLIEKTLFCDRLLCSDDLDPFRNEKFSRPLGPTMVGPAGDTELSKLINVTFIFSRIIFHSLIGTLSRLWNTPRMTWQNLSNIKICVAIVLSSRQSSIFLDTHHKHNLQMKLLQIKKKVLTGHFQYVYAFNE